MRKKATVILLAAVLLSGCGGKQAIEADSTVLLSEPIKYVALTFDDGPKRETTIPLLDGLKELGAAATFFLVGEQIPGNEDIVARMKAEGHQVGNHTWSHIRLENAPAETAAQEIRRTDDAIGAILGGSGYWLRPPYGLPAQEEGIVSVPIIKWSVDPRDWESRDKEKIVEAVMQGVNDGSIILLHDIYPSSVEAALEVVERLQAEGYWFVTVKELLAIKGIQPENGKIYRHG